MARAITVEIVGDPKNLEKAFGKADKATESFAKKMDDVGEKMTKAGKKMTMFVTAPLIALGVKFTQSAEGLNESVNAVNVTFTDAAGTIHEFAEVAAQEAGLSMRQLNELVTPVGAQLQNVGYSADEAADSSINLAKRAADMASVFNTDVETAMMAIQAGLRGQSDPLEQFGVGLTAAAVEAEALEMGLAATAGELDENAKMQARLSLIMKQTDRLAGDFASTSGETANAQRIMAAEAENAAAQFGQKLLPVKLKLIQAASSVIEKFNTMSPAAQNVALAIAGVAAAIGPVLIGVGSLLRATSSVIEHGPKVASKLGSMATGFADMGKAAASGAAKVASAAASLVASAARAAAAAAASVARQVAAWVLLGAQALAQAARVAAAWLIAMGPIALVIAAVIGLVALIVKNWDTIKRVTVQLWESVKRATSAAWNWIKRSVSDAIRFVTNLFLNFTGPGLIIKHWNTIRTATVSAFNAVVSFIAGVPGRIISSLSALGRGLASTARSAWDSFRNATASGANAVASYIASLPRRFVGALGNVGSLLYGAGRDLIEGFLRGVRAMAGRVVSAVTAPISTAIREANRLLGSRSPSRKFAQIGRTIPQGVAVGIMDEAGKVSRAAESMFAGAMTAPHTPAFAGTAAGPGLGFTGMPDVSVTVNIHGNADAATVRDGAHDGVVEAFRELVREARMR